MILPDVRLGKSATARPCSDGDLACLLGHRVYELFSVSSSYSSWPLSRITNATGADLVLVIYADYGPPQPHPRHPPLAFSISTVEKPVAGDVEDCRYGRLWW